MLKATSRKHRMEEERQEEINHENKLLYKKMTEILKNGTGNISPIRGKNNSQSNRNSVTRQDADSILLHYGRSVTAKPS